MFDLEVLRQNATKIIILELGSNDLVKVAPVGLGAPVAVLLNGVLRYPSLKGKGGATPSEAVGRKIRGA